MRKVYVIGFDGATWRFIRPLVDRGEMPNFQRLMEKGSYGELMSTIPFQSAAAWVTFMTGQNSGEHGVYMFQDYDALSYSYVGRTANSRYFSGQTIFAIVGQMGGTVAAIRVPMTYPAWHVNGIMVSGFPLPGDTTEAFFPPELQNELEIVTQPDEPDVRLLDIEEQVRNRDSHMERMSELVRKLLDRRPDLEPPHVRGKRGGEAAGRGAPVPQGWIANLARLDEILGRQKLRMQTMDVERVVDAEGRLNDRQLHDELDARRTAQAKICPWGDAQPSVGGECARAHGARKARVQIAEPRRVKP